MLTYWNCIVGNLQPSRCCWTIAPHMFYLSSIRTLRGCSSQLHLKSHVLPISGRLIHVVQWVCFNLNLQVSVKNGFLFPASKFGLFLGKGWTLWYCGDSTAAPGADTRTAANCDYCSATHSWVRRAGHYKNNPKGYPAKGPFSLSPLSTLKLE